MYATRNRNKFCLSLDNSNTSGSTIHLNRWSEVVPPKAALTFAALWDPDEGMVTFSGAALLESENLSTTSSRPDVFDDDCHSQLISVDRESDSATTTSENTAALATFQDAFKAFLHRKPSTTWDAKGRVLTKAGYGQGAPRCLQSRASSTLDGLDVYSHDIQIKPKQSLHLSSESSLRTPPALGKLRLRCDQTLDTCRAGSEESESSSQSRPSNLRSRFSTTTTSSSNCIDVTSGALHTTRSFETPPVPGWWKHQGDVSPCSSCPSLGHGRRVLRKRRPLDSFSSQNQSPMSSIPSTPRKLSRSGFVSPFPSPSSTATSSSSRTAFSRGQELRGRFPRPIGAPITPTSTPPASPSKSPRLKLRFALLPRRKRQRSSDTAGWVCIDIKPVIRTRFVADVDED